MEILIHGPKFERLWSDSTIKQKEAACRMILLSNCKDIKDWCSNHPSIELGEMNIRQLRTRARKCDVRNYSRKDKQTLIISIQFKEPGNDEVRNDLYDQDNGGYHGTNDPKNRTQEGSVTNS